MANSVSLVRLWFMKSRLCATGLAQLIHSTKATVTKILYVVLNIVLIASCSILDCIESPVAMSYHKLSYKGYL